MKRSKKKGQKRKKTNNYYRKQNISKVPAVKKKKPFNRKFFTILGIALGTALIILLSVFLIAPLFKKDSVDVSKYIIPSASGKNGEGIITYTADNTYLTELLKSYSQDKSLEDDEILGRIEALSTFNVEISKAENLSNNDTVTFNVEFMEPVLRKAGLKTENNEFTYTVTGLE